MDRNMKVMRWLRLGQVKFLHGAADFCYFAAEIVPGITVGSANNGTENKKPVQDNLHHITRLEIFKINKVTDEIYMCNILSPLSREINKVLRRPKIYS